MSMETKSIETYDCDICHMELGEKRPELTFKDEYNIERNICDDCKQAIEEKLIELNR